MHPRGPSGPTQHLPYRPPPPYQQRPYTSPGQYQQRPYPPPGQYQQRPYPPPGQYQQGQYPPPGQYQQVPYPPFGQYQQSPYVSPPPGQYPYGYAQRYGGQMPPQVQPPPPQGRGFDFGLEESSEDEPQNVLFEDKAVRLGFIRKVYCILSLQLLMVTLIVSMCVFVPEARQAAQKYFFLFLLCGLVSLAILLVLTCCPGLSRSFPTNMILLTVFTFFDGIFLAGACAHYKVDEVVLAAGATTLIFFALTIFAFQTKIDFTVCHTAMFAVLIILFVVGITVVIFPTRTMKIIYNGFGALVFSVYIIIDTQSIAGGNRAEILSPEDYVAGAIMLYTDITTLFLNLLDLLSALNDNN
ncbi:protein lifeguard 1-like [Ornithodoros turicata]|uniref:protein lifeguard 1-like n=1 Tax=Ornithodoros turicata TaxID=34597 RepID=UPI00313940B1